MAQMDYNRREPQSNGRRYITVLLLVVVLCLVSFALGLMLGKSGKSEVETTQVQTLPVPQPKAEPMPAAPAAVVETVTPAESATETSVAAPLESESAVTDDPLRQLLPPVEQMPLGSGINAPVMANTEPPPAENKAVAMTGGPEPDTLKPAAVAPEKSPAVQAVAVKTDSGFAVQVASFKHRQDAETMSARLGKEFPVVVRQADLGEKGVWYRVLVGPVATKAEAETLKQGLKKNASTDGFIKKITLSE
nr:SPOR domain-containing protein [uncultured Desulfuromonas sp.]